MQLPKTCGTAQIRACAALLALGLASTCFGQFETASVLGSVLDSQRSGIPQAKVALANVDTGTTQAAAADGNGSYQFLEVRLGRYKVIAEATGFKKTETWEPGNAWTSRCRWAR
jgi:hypothetical protein